ncbi:MAG: ABC transporter ATP-binding protein [Eubacterium sp.]|nr:ABC transporter ATP-binding protein [Eubacterium sp.]
MSDYTLELKGLSVGYNGKALIHDINVNINRGDIITLIGPNGAGKSTILKSITRQLTLIKGEVLYQGKKLEEYSYRDLSTKVAVMLTERMKTELMTCHDIVATGRYPYTGRLGILSHEDEGKVDEAMRSVHAENLGSRDFNAISDGQKQRILLARAFCQEPEVLILDEPTSYLDIRHKLDLLAILRRMAKEKNMTVIMSLHEIDLAMKISDKLLCIKGETIYRYGEPEELVENNMIRELYTIDHGYFDSMFGSIELPKPTGFSQSELEKLQKDGKDAASLVEPKVFVLSNCGTGIPVYRKLQKRNIPFAAGILTTNDVDCRLAELLAAECVSVEPFRELTDRDISRALEVMKKCDGVINAGITIGPSNERLQKLADYASEHPYQL